MIRNNNISINYLVSIKYSVFKNGILILAILSFIIIGCGQKKQNKNAFKSDFTNIEQRTFIGPEYWANPMQDWRVANDRIECLVSDENRNIHLLTRQLGDHTGRLEMKIQVGFFNTDLSILNRNWAGFSLGSRGEFDDYRDNAIFGRGLNIGLSTNGALFIGEPSPNHSSADVMEELSAGVYLNVVITPVDMHYTIDFSVQSSGGKVLGSISKNNVTSEQLEGDLVLVSNFENEDSKKDNFTKSVWFKDWNIQGSKITKYENRLFGPIMFTQYTLSRNVMKLTAQMAPVNLSNNTVELQIKENDEWRNLQTVTIDKNSWTARFKKDNWDDLRDYDYRVVYKLQCADGKKKDYYWEGKIRKNPIKKNEIVIASFTGNNDLGFPNSDIVSQVEYQNPDVLFFSGDQLYESVGGYGFQREPYNVATLDYLRKWYIYGWAYRDLLKNRPTVSITDDHDVYMGNYWGEAGKATQNEGTKTDIQDSGGYRMTPEWINMVERTQTSHLPDPYYPKPVKRGIGVYYTQMNYGGISYAILEDRKFKSAPKALLPEANIVNGWPQNKNYNIKNADIEGAKLLGDRQIDFLENWVSDWSYGAKMKTVLSQTIFANVATLPQEAMTDAVVPKLRILNKGEYPENDYPVTDMDSNGWPQSGRNRAIKTMRKGFAFHIAGDQHLGSVIQYGTDGYRDAGYAFCVPSVSNFWPRRWYPLHGGKNRDINSPKYTGDFEDGFKNKISVYAVSNPLFTNKKPSKLYDRATGFGIVRFNKKERKITMECWPRNADPIKGDSEQYDGWPITIDQLVGLGDNAINVLPKVKVKGLENPVIQVINEKNNSIVYTYRINGSTIIPKVYNKGLYTIKISNPDKNIVKKIENVSTVESSKSELEFIFENEK